MIHILVGQFAVSLDIQHNLEAIEGIVARAKPDSLVVLPEGALSGYQDDLSFLPRIDLGELRRALEQVRAAAARQQVHVMLGSGWYEEGHWYNAGFTLGPKGELHQYRKINLATHERGTFRAGDSLPVLELVLAGQPVKVGMQLCREIRFAEQWQHLARQGAAVLVYLTNTVGDASEVTVWRSHLISRAAENQRFVVCANTAHAAQKCPSMIISPRGRVLWEVLSADTAVGEADLDLSQVSNWYLDQARRDVVAVQGTQK
jgi:predicted amidohydrolase